MYAVSETLEQLQLMAMRYRDRGNAEAARFMYQAIHVIHDLQYERDLIKSISNDFCKKLYEERRAHAQLREQYDALRFRMDQLEK